MVVGNEKTWKFSYTSHHKIVHLVLILGVGSNLSSWAPTTIEVLLKGLFVPLFTSKYKWSNCGLWNSWLIYLKAQECSSNSRSDCFKSSKDCYKSANVAIVTHMNDLS
jgi:hypothetical protein